MDMKGLVTVQFSDAMVIPANFTMFNNRFLQLTVIPGVKAIAG